MSLASLFGFGVKSTESELPELFPLEMNLDFFVETDVLSVYSKILTDCIERTQGIPEDIAPLLWDSCLQNEAPDGLITLLAWAMSTNSELFLVYDRALTLLTEADTDEEKQIKADYEKKGQSDLGIYISFENYNRTEMVKLYSSMEYAVVSSLNKVMNLSKAIQFKMGEMRSSVSLSDSQVAVDQAKNIAKALSSGKDVIIDKIDEIVTGAPDISSIKSSIDFLDAKKCFYYGMPLSYINGEQTAGIGSTGEADTKAVERGLKQYFISILKPVLEALFQISVTFKSNDFRQITSALEAIKTFELVGDDLLSQNNKRLIISKLFDVELESQSEAGLPSPRRLSVITPEE
jgi:hypothetical protein